MTDEKLAELYEVYMRAYLAALGAREAGANNPLRTPQNLAEIVRFSNPPPDPEERIERIAEIQSTIIDAMRALLRGEDPQPELPGRWRPLWDELRRGLRVTR